MSEVDTHVRVAVWQRSNGRCEMCGIGLAEQFHHRMRRREGGHSIPNGLYLCGVCHARAHAHPRWAVENGWIIPTSGGPVHEVPVLRKAEWVLLGPGGEVTPAGPAG